MKQVIVVGGGPSGMMAAYKSAEKNKVILLERNKQLGKKLLLTGNGRCNVTNLCDTEAFLSKVHSNPKFLYSALNQFKPSDMIDFLLKHQCPTKEEDHHRMFPTSNAAATVLQALAEALYERKVEIHCDEMVKELIIEEATIKGVITDKGKYEADEVILCTGGKSFPLTGSDGNGYHLAEQAGHTIKECKPALVSLVTEEEWVQDLQGITLKNVQLTMKKKKLKGDILFTHYGISGPLILNLSGDLKSNVLSIDCFPNLSLEELDQKIVKVFSQNPNKRIINTLTFLPNRMMKVLLDQAYLDEDCLIRDCKKEQRKKLVQFLKCLPLTIVDNRGFNEAMVTKGGVSVKEIDPHTMESKKIKGLKFAGEMMDVDGETGGFNLQIAWSSGFVAGNSL